jgi:superfamily I DNA/RNA helicase
MIVKALENIENGKYKHEYKHIFIDEFQDISTTSVSIPKIRTTLNRIILL